MCGKAAVPNIMQNVSARKFQRLVSRSASPAAPVLLVGYGVPCWKGGAVLALLDATCLFHAVRASSSDAG